MGCSASAGWQRALRGRRPGRSVKDELQNTNELVYDTDLAGPLVRWFDMRYHFLSVLYGEVKLLEREEKSESQVRGRRRE